MDAATAAAMSDPDRNKWFRRRWADSSHPPKQAPGRSPQPPAALELTGYALLEQWRSERARHAGGAE